MTRPKQSSRTTQAGTDPETRQVVPNELPSLRKRRPFMYWAVVVGVAAMLLTVVSAFFLSAGGTTHSGFGAF